MLLVEVFESEGALLPWHSGPMASKVGLSNGFIVMVKVDGLAHWSALGVKV
jgi:hypothetical protein